MGKTGNREAASYVEQERARVADMLKRDAEERAADERRQLALEQIERGIDVNVADTVVAPTPELLRTGTFIPFTPGRKNWTDRDVKTVRRLSPSQISLLYGRGVLDDRTAKACLWYRDRYDAAQMEPKAPVASYGETVRGDAIYGHLPATEWAAEARRDIRWAREFIPADMLPMFEMVVCGDATLTEAAKAARLRFRNFSAAFKLCAERLYDGVAECLRRCKLPDA